MQNATGKWICAIDADDFLDNTFFEVMIDTVDRFDPDIISIGYKEVIYDNNRWQINKIVNVTDKIIQLTSDKKLRMQNMCEKKFIANLWCKLLLLPQIS